MISTASVGITSTTFVSMLSMSSSDAAAVAADEADGHPDQRRDAGAERADQEARAAGRRRTGCTRPARAPSSRASARATAARPVGIAELERVGVGEPRPDDREDEEEHATTTSPTTSFRFRNAK